MKKNKLSFRFIAIAIVIVQFSFAQSQQNNKSQLDSLAKVAYQKRVANQDAKGISDATETINAAKANALGTKEIAFYSFPKNELPDFSELKNLESFSCTRCTNLNLEKLFEQLSKFPKLKSVALVSCNIKAMPSSIEKLKAVETLNLKDNNFSTLPESFIELKNLRHLSFEHCGYLYDEVVWERLAKLNVETLNFSASVITDINDKIGNVSSLKHINFALNDIRTLPASFNKLTSLRSLSFAENHQLNLSSIFQSLAQLSSFESLNLNECLLESLPAEIGTPK
jgi:Leucine-rich repeat (LRR) protein